MDRVTTGNRWCDVDGSSGEDHTTQADAGTGLDQEAHSGVGTAVWSAHRLGAGDDLVALPKTVMGNGGLDNGAGPAWKDGSGGGSVSALHEVSGPITLDIQVSERWPTKKTMRS